MPGHGVLPNGARGGMTRQYQCSHSLPHIPKFSSVLPSADFSHHTAASTQLACPSAPTAAQPARQHEDWYCQLRHIGAPATSLPHASVFSLTSVPALEPVVHWNQCRLKDRGLKPHTFCHSVSFQLIWFTFPDITAVPFRLMTCLTVMLVCLCDLVHKVVRVCTFPLFNMKSEKNQKKIFSHILLQFQNRGCLEVINILF